MRSKFERSEVITWESRVQRAYTAEDLIMVVKDFLATWGPEELAALPEHLRPGHIRDGEDISLYAFRLMSRPSLPDGNSHILVRMNTFFGTASHRLSQILSIAAAEARARTNEDAAT